MRALDLAASVPWVIRPEALESILAIAAREDIPEEVVAATMTNGSPEAVSARLGKPMDNTHAVSIRDGVAVIPVAGPIFRHANLFSEISGATTTEAIAHDLTTALESPSVRSILLEIDSPGGEVAGIAELAGMIRAAHGQKPVTAYVDNVGASAAYWLASAAGDIVAAPTAVLGSIGVVAVMKDPSKTKSTDLEFVSSKSPNKRPDLMTEAGKAQVQATVDALADVFFADVARYRGVAVETVHSDFGQGGIFVGQQAVDAGLADRVGSFEQTLRDLADQPAPAKAAPASHVKPTPLRRDAPGRKTAMSMREKFFGWLDGLDAPASADQEAAIVTDNLNTQPALPAPTPVTVAAQNGTPTWAVSPSAADAETARMQAELATYRAENQRLRTAAITREAVLFATEMIRDGRAMPSEQAAIIDAFTQASIDDGVIGAVSFADGRTTSRVEIVKRQYQDRQSVRALFAESVGDDVLMALHNRQATPKKGDEAPSADEVTKLIGMTAFGQSVIATRNGATKN